MKSEFQVGQTGRLCNGSPFTVITNALRGNNRHETLVVCIPTDRNGSAYLQLTADGRYPPNPAYDVLPTA